MIVTAERGRTHRAGIGRLRTEPTFETFGTTVLGSRIDNIFELDRQEVIDQFRSSGALIFKGFGIDSKGFERFSGQFTPGFMTYQGGGYERRTINGDGDKSILSVNYYLGSEEQSTFALPLHGEMYYLKSRPVLIWFYCVRPALQDGETTLCDGVEVYRQLSDSTKRLFREKRLLYIRTYTKAQWHRRFQTTDLDVVEKFCRATDQHVRIDRENETVYTEYFYPAFSKSRWGDEDVFINNIMTVTWQERSGKADSVVRLEDGSPIPEDVLAEIDEVTGRLTRWVPWEPGNFVMVDNTRVLHGRRAFNDNVRQVYSRMTASVEW